MTGDELGVGGARLIALGDFPSDIGRLVVAEAPMSLPFVPRRAFALFDIPRGVARGTHAHRECHQFLVCLRGSVTALIDDGDVRREVVLDRADLGLHMPPMLWGTQSEYSTDALLLVFASHPYDANDYIEDYQEFLALVRERPGPHW